MRRATNLLGAMAASVLLSCMFNAEDAEGLECNFDDDCGPDLSCIEQVCAKPGSLPSETDGGVSTTSTSTSGSSDTADDSGDDSGPPPSCPYTNDGACDEPEGTGVCPEGSDVADCTTSPSCGNAGDGCATEPCCDSIVCVNFEGSGSICSDQCSYGTECQSCCCASTDQGQDVCAPTNFCEGSSSECNPGVCGLGGSPCFSDSQCCNGDCLENTAGQLSCFKRCTLSSECNSGCCAQGYCQGLNSCS